MPRSPDDKIKSLNMCKYSNFLPDNLLFYWPNSYLGNKLVFLSPSNKISGEKKVTFHPKLMSVYALQDCQDWQQNFTPENLPLGGKQRKFTCQMTRFHPVGVIIDQHL